MARSKLGRQAERVATAAEIEQQLHEVCAAAKKYAEEGNQVKYDEAHLWLTDLLSTWELTRMMMSPRDKSAGQR